MKTVVYLYAIKKTHVSSWLYVTCLQLYHTSDISRFVCVLAWFMVERRHRREKTQKVQKRGEENQTSD